MLVWRLLVRAKQVRRRPPWSDSVGGVRLAQGWEGSIQACGMDIFISAMAC